MKEGVLTVAITVAGVTFPEVSGLLLTVLVLCIGVDFITGVRASKKKLQSSKMNATVNKLLAYLSLSLVGGILEILTFSLTKTFAPPLFMIATAFCISREIVSILENVQKLGVSYPKVFDNFIQREEPKNDI